MKRKLQQDKRNGNYFIWIQHERVSKYFRFGSNKKLAEKELEQVERDIAAGKIQFIEQATSRVIKADGRSDLRIEELAHKHLAWVKANRANETFLLRQHFVCRFLDFVGECMVSSLNFEKLEGFRAMAARENTRSGNGNEALRHIKTMLKWATEFEVCDMPVKRYPKIHATRPETRNFTPDELTKLLAAADDDFRDFIFFSVATGLRPSEARQLKRQDICASSNGDCNLRIESHKTAKSAAEPKPRSVPLCSEALAIVQRQMKAQKRSDFIFLNGDGTPYTSDAYRRRLTRLCKKIGMKKAKPPYGLRHSFGTMEAAEGVNQSILAQLMGHSKLQTTDRYIAHVDSAHKKAVEAIGKGLSQLLPRKAEGESAAAENGLKVATEVATDKSLQIGEGI